MHNTKSSPFLTAEWRKLIMANYAVDPSVLAPYVPHGTELDLWNNTCYVSLVGFMFLNTKVKGFSIPFHVNFEEVNLRFYVRYPDKGEWKRGVVFIKEIVSKQLLTLVANTVYHENYETLPMSHSWEDAGTSQRIEYKWKKTGWNSLSVNATRIGVPIMDGSEEEFITEHYWGYTKVSDSATSEYGVEHPKWQVYPIESYDIAVDFGNVYGQDFEFLNRETPLSVFLAEGSEIRVLDGRKL